MSVKSLTVLILLTYTLSGSAEELKEVLEERSACLYHSALQFSCPEDHIVVLRRAYYLVGQEEGCHPDATDVCELENIIEEWFLPCHGSHTCEIPVRAPNTTAGTCAGYRGEPFLKVTYKCETYMGTYYETSMRDLCEFGSTFTGSLMYLWSSNFPYFSNDLDCGCQVTVDTDIELKIKVPYFDHKLDEYDNSVTDECVQALDIQGGNVRKTICSHHNDTTAPVDIDVARDVYLHYRNPHQYSGRIWIVLQVHYKHNFTLDCHRNFHMPELPTLTNDLSTSSTNPETTQSESSQQEQFAPVEQNTAAHWPIVTGVVVVLCVLLVVGIAVLLFCRTRLRDKIMKQKGMVETENFRFENNVYMTHGQVEAQSTRSSESGSQPQLFVTPSSAAHALYRPRATTRLQGDSPLPRKSDSSRPLPTTPEEQEASANAPDVIPEAVLQRLASQSETAHPEVSDIKGVEVERQGQGNNTGNVSTGCGDIYGGTSGNANSSVKDRARLIEGNTPTTEL